MLLLIVSGEDEATIDEINTINELIQSEAGSTNIIMGLGEDINLQNEIENHEIQKTNVLLLVSQVSSTRLQLR